MSTNEKNTPIVLTTIGIIFLKTLINQAFEASSIATATATVIPTMGLLPAPMSPIISLQKQLKRFKTLVNQGVRHIAPWEKLVTSSTAIITGKRSLSSGS